MSGKENILIVDDEGMIVDLLRDILEAENYEVYSASSGSEACAQLKKINPDIVLLDLELPEVSGIEILKIIQKEHKRCRVIVISGHFKNELQQSGLLHPWIQFLQKPFTAENVLSAIQQKT